MARRLRGAALALLAILPTACAYIGPTARIDPGPGKSSDAFTEDRRACMAETDGSIQPMANRLNAVIRPLERIAADNQAIQRAYDDAFMGCMAARGNLPAGSTAVAGAGTEPRPTGASSAAGSGPGSGWQPLQLSYHALSGRPKNENDALWAREIADPPAGPGGALPIYSIRFDDGAATVLLSIAGQRQPICDDGPQGAAVTRDYALCPGKLALIEGGRPTAIRATGPLCAEVINDGGVLPGAPGWQDPRLWGTRGRYDAASGMIELVTMQNGRAEPACSKRISVR
jgi:hypothetical protein